MNTILIIEDQPQMRQRLGRILEMEGYRSLVAADGCGGIDLAIRERPDLIICDIIMPGMNGHDVLRSIRTNITTAATPFIFLTALDEHRDQRAGMNLGADDYLTKPVQIDDLLAAIRARLSRNPRSTTPDFANSTPLIALGLTAREAEVLLWVAQGKTNLETGTILHLSSGTVRKHLEHIFTKLGVENRTAACLRAVEALTA
jgi:DNA-binding NarL/FixJ family response regulator